jgi:hypothetical protein
MSSILPRDLKARHTTCRPADKERVDPELATPSLPCDYPRMPTQTVP